MYVKVIAWAVLASAVLAFDALAQATMADAAGAIEGVPLPAEFKGRWDYQRRLSNIWSVRFDRIDAEGRLSGRITYWGRRCIARDEVIKSAAWREGELTIVAFGGGECGDMNFKLRRGKERFFEGEGRAAYDPTISSQVWLDAPK